MLPFYSRNSKMYKLRHRRMAGGCFNSASAKYGWFSVCVAGTVLLFLSLCLFQNRLSEDSRNRSGSLAKENHNSNVKERAEWKLLEGDGKNFDLEGEFKSMLTKEGDADALDETSSDDDLDTEFSSDASGKEDDDDEEGLDGFAELDSRRESEMDLDSRRELEMDDVDESDGFQGDVGEWLNEIDETSGSKFEKEDLLSMNAKNNSAQNSSSDLNKSSDEAVTSPDTKKWSLRRVTQDVGKSSSYSNLKRGKAETVMRNHSTARFELGENVQYRPYLEDGRGAFNTDDESVNDDTLKRMEKIVDVEDVLMIRKNSGKAPEFKFNKFSGKSSSRKESPSQGSYDLLNPFNNPLLQDPDTNEGSGVTQNDNELLRTRRDRALASKTFMEGREVLQTHVELDGDMKPEDSGADGTSIRKFSKATYGKSQAGTGIISEEALSGNDVRQSSERRAESEMLLPLESPTNSVLVGKESQSKLSRRVVKGVKLKSSNDHELSQQGRKESREEMLHTKVDSKGHRSFHRLVPKLSSTKNLEELTFGQNCELRVFMAWTTPAWSFTVRHQRAMESLLNFHPKACVVVFSESLESDCFQSFVAEGYSVAVRVPQVQELLEGTPLEVFSTIYVQWREVSLFYLHYTELLRLAALYKYGGVYLDFDMIVLKPLTGLNNTFGRETLENGRTRPNGAVMFFDKHSQFLNACMVEYTASYDDKLEQWNGAGLLDRVVKSHVQAFDLQMSATYTQHRPATFFPFSSVDIHRYFFASEDKTLREAEDILYEKILAEAYTVHLWNSLTLSILPEPGSLVYKFMERNCLHCTDIL